MTSTAQLGHRREELKVELQAFMAVSQPTAADAEAYKVTLAQFQEVTQTLEAVANGGALPSLPLPPRAEPRASSSQQAAQAGSPPLSSTPAPTQAALPAAPAPVPAAPTPPAVCVVQCPKCKNQLKVPSQENVHSTYQCPACTARFMVQHHGAPTSSPVAPPQPPPPQQQQQQPPPPPSQSSKGASSDKLYQAACPRCSHNNQFKVPADRSSAPTRLAITCSQCKKPFAIQV